MRRCPGSPEESHPADLFEVKHDLREMLKIESCCFLWVFKYLVSCSATDAALTKNLSGSIVQDNGNRTFGASRESQGEQPEKSPKHPDHPQAQSQP